MHELSICQSIIQQAMEIAEQNHAFTITRIDLAIGPLAGVEIPLLQQAFPLAAAGTLAENAQLNAEALPIRVRCLSCFKESEALPNRLVCGHCQDWHTQLVSGDEMLIKSIELDTEEDVNYV